MDGDSPIAIDPNTGGYPYKVPLERAQIWKEKAAAEKYASIFGGNLRVVKIRIEIIENDPK